MQVAKQQELLVQLARAQVLVDQVSLKSAPLLEFFDCSKLHESKRRRNARLWSS